MGLMAMMLKAPAAAGGGGSYDATVLALSGLSHFWKLSEASGTSVADSKGTQSGTLHGGSLGVAALLSDGETSYNMSAASAFIDLGGPVALGSGGAFSLGLVYKPAAVTASNVLFDNGSDSNGYRIVVQSGGVVNFQINGGGAHLNFSTTAALSAGTVYHLLFTYDGTTNGVIYVNGASNATGTGTGAITPTTACYLGGYTSVTGFSSTGLYEKVFTCTAALASSDAAALYAAR